MTGVLAATAGGGWPIVSGLNYGTVFGYEKYGPSHAGTGGIAPTLQMTGSPQPGNAITMSVAGTAGGATTVLVAGSGEALTPLGSAVLLVASPSIAVWGVASGAVGTAGTGSMTVPFMIPNAAGLRRQRVSFQGFTLDVNSAGGLAATAGLTMIIL